MVSLMTSSSSSFVSIQFRRGIFNFFASSNSDVLFIYYQFCNPRQVTKRFLAFFLHLKKSIHHHHYHHSAYYIVGFLYRCIYTPQHIPEDDNFNLVCRQNRSLTLPLNCNTCHMEHHDHENLSLCVRSTFSTYHGCTCLLLLSVLSPFFQITVTQPHSKSFNIKIPTPLPQRH